MFKRMRTCSVCHKESNQTIIGSTSTFGGCDLDTRPAPLARYLISSRIQTCPHCGYTNYDISNAVEEYFVYFSIIVFISLLSIFVPKQIIESISS